MKNKRTALYRKAAISHFNERSKSISHIAPGICIHLAKVAFGNSQYYDCVTESNFPELFLFKDKRKSHWTHGAYWVRSQFSTEGHGNNFPPLNELRETILLFCHEMSKD